MVQAACVYAYGTSYSPAAFTVMCMVLMPGFLILMLTGLRQGLRTVSDPRLSVPYTTSGLSLVFRAMPQNE